MLKEGFSQAAYDKFLHDKSSATLKAQGGSYGGGSETLIIQENDNDTIHAENSLWLSGGGKGALIQEDKSATLATNNDQTLFAPVGIDGYNAATTGDKSSTLGVNCGMSTGRNGVYQSYVVRRLTPMECERLQGFPDRWTEIGDFVDTKGKQRKQTDSARYKALGNSIAIPPWFYVLQKLSLCCGTDHNMASLFDGIGGFPLIWEMLNGTGSCLWASEIEDFPIAVTKVRFPEEVHT